MTHAEPAPRPARPATIDGRPAYAALADSVERCLAAVFGTPPASHPEAGPTTNRPDPALEEA